MRSRGLQFTPKRLGEFNALNVNYREQGNALIKRRLPAICWDDSLRRAYRTGRKVLRRVLKLIYGCSRMLLNVFLRHRWAFAEWLQSVPEEESRQLGNMLLFLLFPDIFERIFGGTERYQIASHFSKKPKTAINHMTQIMIDRELQMIRSELEEQYQTKDLDFYVPPLTALWKGSAFKRNTSGLNRDHVLRALQEIDNNGIPPDAKATTYDLIHGANRYPPKYVLSLACKYASGHNQIRAHSQTSSPRITSPGDSRLFMASPSTNSSANSGKMNLTDLLSTLSIKCRD